MGFFNKNGLWAKWELCFELRKHPKNWQFWGKNYFWSNFLQRFDIFLKLAFVFYFFKYVFGHFWNICIKSINKDFAGVILKFKNSMFLRGTGKLCFEELYCTKLAFYLVLFYHSAVQKNSHIIQGCAKICLFRVFWI